VTALVTTSAAHRIEAEDFVVAGLGLADGAVGSVLASTAALADFVDAVAAGRPPIVPDREALRGAPADRGDRARGTHPIAGAAHMSVLRPVSVARPAPVEAGP
jgi:hypothetical protein